MIHSSGFNTHSIGIGMQKIYEIKLVYHVSYYSIQVISKNLIYSIQSINYAKSM